MQVAESGLPWRNDAAGNVVKASPAEAHAVFKTAEGPKALSGVL